MNIYQFMNESPMLTFFLGWMITWMIAYIIVMPIKFFFRSRNIAVRGWPPEHLDADGDFNEDGVDNLKK